MSELKRAESFGTQDGEKPEEYYLMNKDVVIAKFKVIGEGELERIFIIEEYNKLPVWIGDLGRFIRNRRAPKHRENIEKLLQISGCDTISGYLNLTHALSLVDTFWVKPVDNTLEWKSVSLFRNPFNEVIAKTAFDGGLHGRDFGTTSPEYGTDGSFAKCWIRENGVIKMLKRGSSGARNAGREPYSEFYASQIAKEFGQEYVDYSLRTCDSKLCSVCECFTSEELGYLPFTAVDKQSTGIADVLDTASEFGLEKEFRTMFVLDAVIFNEDRHKGNFGFLVNNAAQTVEGFAPLFDHNISLLTYAEEEDLTGFTDYVKGRRPRLGSTFVSVAKAVMTPELRKVLINLSDFEFTRDKKYNLPEWRLKALEKIMHQQIKDILN